VEEISSSKLKKLSTAIRVYQMSSIFFFLILKFSYSAKHLARRMQPKVVTRHNSFNEKGI